MRRTRVLRGARLHLQDKVIYYHPLPDNGLPDVPTVDWGWMPDKSAGYNGAEVSAVAG